VLATSSNASLAAVAATLEVGADASDAGAVRRVKEIEAATGKGAFGRGARRVGGDAALNGTSAAAAAAPAAPVTPEDAKRALRRLLQAPGNEFGAFQQIINPDLGRSSTGALAIHAAMVPATNTILVWGRVAPSYEPGMTTGERLLCVCMCV
jgi:hypothetical protein